MRTIMSTALVMAAVVCATVQGGAPALDPGAEVGGIKIPESLVQALTPMTNSAQQAAYLIAVVTNTALSSENPSLRTCAVFLLGKTLPQAAIEPLIEHIDLYDPKLKSYPVVNTLPLFGEALLPRLITFIDGTEDRHKQHLAVQTVLGITKESFNEYFDAHKQDFSAKVRQALLEHSIIW